MTPRASSRPPVEPAQAIPDLADIPLVTVLHALSDPVRLEIVSQLAGCRSGDALACGQVVVPVGKSTASHHLKTLTAAGIIAYREEGTRKLIWLRRDELEQRFPGLIESVLRAATAA